MGPKKGVTAAARLTDDLVVEILSRLPFKSFCCFKCVCKTWLAFSSDPHYRKKLPRILTGFLYQSQTDSNFATKLIGLSQSDEEIHGILSFVPHHEHLELLYCCNGLVLCKYRSSYTPPDICRFIVCNPATKEWRMLPDTHSSPDDSHYTAILAYDPSWSPQFHVFNFEQMRMDGAIFGVRKLRVFSSAFSTWLMDDRWNFEIPVSFDTHLFVDGVLYVQTTEREIFVFQGWEAMMIDASPYHWTIQLPHETFYVANYTRGRLSRHLGVLHYAFPEEDGQTILVWRFGYNPYGWTVKYRLNMREALGRDDFVEYDMDGNWSCNYQIVALDMDREIIFLFDYTPKNQLLSYNFSTGEVNKIQEGCHWQCSKYYVPCYSKLPAQEPCTPCSE